MKNLTIKVGMLILLESDLEGAIEFYKKIGLQLKFHLKEKWAEFDLGAVKFGLCPTSQSAFERHTGIVLEVNDLKNFIEELKKKEVDIFVDIKEAPHGLMASIKDPGGNIIDLYQPTPEKLKEMAEKAAKNEL